MTPMDIIKSNVGSFLGIAKSKKYGLTVGWVSFLVFMILSTANTTEKIVYTCACSATIIGYQFAQGWVESNAASKALDADREDEPAKK